MAEMSPRSRVEAIFRGQRPDRVPLVIWNNKLPEGPIGRAVLDAGACVVVKSRVWRRRQRTIPVHVQREVAGGDEPLPGGAAGQPADGYQRERLIYDTPAGRLTSTLVRGHGTTWLAEWPFKSEADYDALLAWLADTDYSPCYEDFLADDRAYGPRGLARPATEKSPLFELLYEIMGVMNFAVQWQDNRPRVLELYEALLAARRKRLSIVADSPAQYAVVDGNVEMSVVGKQRFAEYYAPAIRQACDLMHAHGKLAGVHLDGDNRLLAEPVAKLPVDMIESFTPPPDCDLSISDARAVWPEKFLMVNFPSSVHLAGPEAVRRTAERLLAEARTHGRVILGVMEDVPRADTLPVLAEAVRDFGAL